MAEYYKKDKKATVYRTQEGYETDEGIVVPGGYKAICDNVWCYSKQFSQDFILRAREYGSRESRMFVFNAGLDIQQGDFIRYRDDWYEVTRVDTLDDYNTDLYVYAAIPGKDATPDIDV